jgi:hypothetical protein
MTAIRSNDREKHVITIHHVVDIDATPTAVFDALALVDQLGILVRLGPIPGPVLLDRRRTDPRLRIVSRVDRRSRRHHPVRGPDPLFLLLALLLGAGGTPQLNLAVVRYRPRPNHRRNETNGKAHDRHP